MDIPAPPPPIKVPPGLQVTIFGGFQGWTSSRAMVDFSANSYIFVSSFDLVFLGEPKGLDFYAGMD